jgi:glycosyltransferase involved in cell wall biosynthesis
LCDQGLAHHEYVIAISDNCSNDETPDVVAEYQDRLQIVYHRNSETISQKANWEVVDKLCETPYVSFLPDDDLLAPGQLGRALSVFDAHAGAVVVSPLIVVQRYPGDPESRIPLVFFRATAHSSYSEPYVWDTSEWLALNLLTSRSSIVGSVFQHEVLRRCELHKRYKILGDRVLMAEIALHGEVLSLPWIGAYRRMGEHRQSWRGLKEREVGKYEKAQQTREILDLCEKRNLPVLEFLVDQIYLSGGTQQQGFYLEKLRRKLPSYAYTEIHNAVNAKQERLHRQLRRTRKQLERSQTRLAALTTRYSSRRYKLADALVGGILRIPGIGKLVRRKDTSGFDPE